MIQRADTLTRGDVFVHGWDDDAVLVTVIGDREPWHDRFTGRDGYQIMCVRHDTGAQGYMRFGPEGVVQAVTMPVAQP